MALTKALEITWRMQRYGGGVHSLACVIYCDGPGAVIPVQESRVILLQSRRLLCL
jgi:hypothetical protein